MDNPNLLILWLSQEPISVALESISCNVCDSTCFILFSLTWVCNINNKGLKVNIIHNVKTIIIFRRSDIKTSIVYKIDLHNDYILFLLKNKHCIELCKKGNINANT